MTFTRRKSSRTFVYKLHAFKEGSKSLGKKKKTD